MFATILFLHYALSYFAICGDSPPPAANLNECQQTTNNETICREKKEICVWNTDQCNILKCNDFNDKNINPKGDQFCEVNKDCAWEKEKCLNKEDGCAHFVDPNKCRKSKSNYFCIWDDGRSKCITADDYCHQWGSRHPIVCQEMWFCKFEGGKCLEDPASIA